MHTTVASYWTSRASFGLLRVYGEQDDMTPIRIGNKTARQLWLTAQGLAENPTGPLDVLGIIRKLGFVQLDTIQVVARAHHHILWSRNQNYREPMLDRLLAKDRVIFEHFTHDASVLPMEFLPMWRRQFARKTAELDRPGWMKSMPDADGRAKIKDRIRREGALSTKDFEAPTKRSKEMWARPPHKLALDYLWYSGELATCHRVNFTKHYDLAERVFPDAFWSEEIPEHTQVDWLCHQAMDRLGFATHGDIQRFWEAVSNAEARDWCAANGKTLCPVDVETHDKQWVPMLAPADVEARLNALKPPTSRLRILNPFDPVIRDRARLSRLFGFEYRVEMFVPAAKRVWGYYVFPLLEGARFVGRIEVKADRKASVLRIAKLWTEPGVRWTSARQNKLDAELERMRRFVGVERTTWDA